MAASERLSAFLTSAWMSTLAVVLVKKMDSLEGVVVVVGGRIVRGYVREEEEEESVVVDDEEGGLRVRRKERGGMSDWLASSSEGHARTLRNRLPMRE